MFSTWVEFITYDTLVACTSQPVLILLYTLPVPQATWAYAAVSSNPSHKLHCNHSSQTTESVSRELYLNQRKTHTFSHLLRWMQYQTYSTTWFPNELVHCVKCKSKNNNNKAMQNSTKWNNTKSTYEMLKLRNLIWFFFKYICLHFIPALCCVTSSFNNTVLNLGSEETHSCNPVLFCPV